jgi:hypothetical protein
MHKLVGMQVLCWKALGRCSSVFRSHSFGLFCIHNNVLTPGTIEVADFVNFSLKGLSYEIDFENVDEN